MKSSRDSLKLLTEEIVSCERCPRLRRYGEEIARVKRRAYRDETYWGKPVPGFGDPQARLAVIGLAPGAHGANRTGRIFTGDGSGDYLYRALFETGFSNQAESRSAHDGLTLRDAYITGPVRCAPPDNKPTPEEFARCRPFLERELALLPPIRVVVVLGKLASDAYLGILKDRGVVPSRAAFPFGHGREYALPSGSPVLLGCYHPSRQNTSTGKLTAAMLRDIFARARAIIGG
jgi:uracil-DNA glycosylase family 4